MNLFLTRQKTSSFAFLEQVVQVGHFPQIHMLLYFSLSCSAVQLMFLLRPSSSVRIYPLPVTSSSSLLRTRVLLFLHQPRIC
jgi:hypothetical protein